MIGSADGKELVVQRMLGRSSKVDSRWERAVDSTVLVRINTQVGMDTYGPDVAGKDIDICSSSTLSRRSHSIG